MFEMVPIANAILSFCWSLYYHFFTQTGVIYTLKSEVTFYTKEQVASLMNSFKSIIIKIMERFHRLKALYSLIK